MTNLVGTVALGFWIVTFVNDLTNVEIISNWIDNDKLCFRGVINVQFAQGSYGGWQIQMTSSQKLSSLNSSHADIQENNGDGYFHVLTNKAWNSQFIAEQTMVVPFLACASETDKVPDITAEFYRHNEICPEVTPPLERHSMQVPNVIENQWNTGFQAYLNVTPPVTVLDGWKIYFASSRPLSSLDVSQATSIPSQGDIFTFESMSWNRQIMAGSSLLIHYVGHKASATDPTPCITALFTWIGAEDGPSTTPWPTTKSNDGTTPQTTLFSELPTKYSTEPTTDQPSTTENPTVKPTSAITDQPSTTENPPPKSTTSTITDQPATTENPTTTIGTKTTNVPPSCAPYNYTEVLHKSILFYEAQRSGPLPSNNRIPWRGDSALGDKGDNGENLTGGWYDAGDFVKFGFPMAFSTTLLSWGLIEFPQGYSASGELQNMLDCIRWPLDYFIKAHVNPEEFYGQVGNGDIDHAYWGRPEDMTVSRPAYKIDRNKPGSDLAAETAAAMAAGSIAFREKEPSYAELLLNHSKSLYNFADQYRGKYSDSISDAAKFYRSSNYNDELVWGAAWLYKATRDENYLQKAERYFTQYGMGDPGWAFSWDEKTSGLQMLLYELTGKSIYQTAIEKSLDAWLPGGSVSYTPKGLAWRIKWGSNRYAANTAFLALLASQKRLKSSTYKAFGEKQIHYMLGDNGRSYVVGFGTNPPTRPHHSSSSCPNKPAPCNWDDFNNPGPNPQILYGALVGGPDQNDFYEDKRNDFIMNEVTCDYNAGFQSAVAALKSIDISSCSATSTVATSLSSPTNSLLTTLQVTTDKTATTESSTTSTGSATTDNPATTESSTTSAGSATTDNPATTESSTTSTGSATTDNPATTESSTTSTGSTITDQPATTEIPPTEITSTITDQPQTTKDPIAQTTTSITTNVPPSCAPYNYTDVLHKSILFYEAQRSGPLPSNNRIPWRGDSALGDKGGNGENLTGGWYDAGDFVKFGFPMAFSTTLLSWGLIEFPQSYSASAELQNMLDCIRWPLDYFIKAHVNPEEFYGQVGNGDIDHAYWGRPEDMTISRPAYKIDRNKPGSDLAAETAAAMAAGSIAFREKEPSYAELLLNHSKSLYDFADQYRGKYSDSISDAAKFYRSSNYNDELVWGAAWLYKATRDENYLQKAERYFTQYGMGDPGWAFSWDEKTSGLQMLLYELTGKSIYQTAIEKSLDAWLPGGSVSYTPKGLAWRIKWGSNRYAANTAFLALLASQKGLKSSTYKAFGEKQIHYMLGDNGRSYVVGFGTNPPTRPHHSSSSCPNKPAPCNWDDFNNPGPNPQILYGALVGGPDQNDFYEDKRNDFIMNEVTCDYNAGFQSAVAALKSIDISSCSATSTVATSLSSPTNSLLTTLQVTTDKTATTESSTSSTASTVTDQPATTENPTTAFTSTITGQPLQTTTNRTIEFTSTIGTDQAKTTKNPTTEFTSTITIQPSSTTTTTTTTTTTENPNTEITSAITDQPQTTKNPTTEFTSTITDQPSTTENPTTEITSTVTMTDQPTTETTKSPTEPHACGDVSVPSEFNSLELPVVVLQDWPQGFTGRINLTAPAGVRDGWEIVLLLKKAISFLEVYVVTTSPTSGTKFTLKNKDYNKELAEGSVTLVDFKATKQNENDDVPCTRAVFMWAKEVPCPTIAPVSGSQSLDATVDVENQWNEGISGKILVLVPAGVDNGWRVRFIVDKPITLNVYIATRTPSTGTMFDLTNMDYNKVLTAGTTFEIAFDGTKQEIGSTVLCTSAIFLW